MESTDSLEERTNSHHPRDAYLAAAERHASGLVGLRRRFRWVETGRVVTFLVGAIAGLLYRDLPISPVVTLVIAGASGVVFIALVVRHRRLRRKIRRAEAAETLARLGSLRLGRRWSEMADALASVGYDDPLLLPSTSDESHPYLWDLDLFGVASVRALLGPTPTPTGVETLRRWLSAPAPIAEVRRRQSAVRSRSRVCWSSASTVKRGRAFWVGSRVRLSSDLSGTIRSRAGRATQGPRMHPVRRRRAFPRGRSMSRASCRPSPSVSSHITSQSEGFRRGRG